MRCSDAGQDQVGVWLEADSPGRWGRVGVWLGVELIGASSGQVGAHLGWRTVSLRVDPGFSVGLQTRGRARALPGAEPRLGAVRCALAGGGAEGWRRGPSLGAESAWRVEGWSALVPMVVTTRSEQSREDPRVLTQGRKPEVREGM